MVFLGLVAFAVYALIILKKEKKEKGVIVKTMLVAGLSFVVMYFSAAIFDAIFHSIQEGMLVFGGITWEGGVIGGFTAFLLLSHWLVKKERGNEISLFSLIIPGLVLAHAFGRMGCFLGGCCFGNVTEGPLGVVFPTGSPAAETYPNTLTHIGSFPVLPTQLFEVVFEVLLFIVMLVFRKRLRDKNLAIYLVFYGIFRFILEFWRGDDRGATGFFLSPSQLMSIFLLIVGVCIYLLQKGILFKKLSAKMEIWREKAKNGDYDKKEYALSPEKAEIFKQVEALYALKNAGAITEEEYEEKKKQLLDKI